MTSQRSIGVVMTCHNRVAGTLKCLQLYYEQADALNLDSHVYLVDDGSTDGTGAAVREKFPAVNVIEGDGSLFWNGGMHLALSHALEQDLDFYLWLNDDSFLHPDGLSLLLETYDCLAGNGKGKTIVVGSMQDPETGEFTYGGYQRVGRLHPLRLQLTPPSDEPRQCTTMCGNLVLVPRSVIERVGNVEQGFLHRWGDVDYGLRAVAQGCEVVIAPGFAGTCAANPNADVWRDASSPLLKRFDELHDVKGLHKDDWLLFTRRHGGWLWILIWSRPYLNVLSSHITHRLRRLLGDGAAGKESGQ